jgi:hypothetical protein
MILWAKRAAAVLSGIFLMALLFPAGSLRAGMAGGILNLALAMAEKFPPSFRRILPPLVLVINTMFMAYGVLIGGPVAWAILIAGLSLLSWNADLFSRRWPGAPPDIQYRYIRHLGGTIALGLGAGMSAWAFQGHIACPFVGALLLMLIAGILFLRLVADASWKEKRS